MRNLQILPTFVLLLSMITVARAQEVADSLDSFYQLDELVVEGRTQKVVQNGIEYIPGKKMKKMAIDAFGLLYNMQIPQLTISPIDHSIKSATGDGVSLFIDFVPATEQDLQSLRPEDVLRVEVLEYPQDARFKSEARVVNFIMRKYEWGGYTKITATGRTLNDDFVSGSVYEKFKYKRWSFDASASSYGVWQNTYRSTQDDVFKDFMFNGNRCDMVSRTSSTTDYYAKTDNEQASLRAAWSGNSSYISHSVSFSRSGNPDQRKNLAVSFSDDLLPSTDAIDVASSQSISCAISGYYQFVLPNGNFINADWSFAHSGNKQYSDYTLGNMPSIKNGNSEKTYSPNFTLYYSKNLGHNNTIRGMASSWATFYHTDYLGTFDVPHKLTTSESMLFLEYMQNWGFGLSLYSRVGASYVFSHLNGEDIMHEWNPRLGVQLQYQINTKNNVSFEAWWNNSAPQAFTANNAIVQDNELLWIQGNPDLKNIYGPMITATYSLIPTNNFSMMAAFKYNSYANIPVFVFNEKPGYNGLVRTFSDDNTEQEISGLLSASLRLFDNSLALYASGEVKREIYTGIHPMRQTSFYGFVQASYYVRNFSFTLYYSSPNKRIVNTEGFVKTKPQAYGLNVSYSIGELKANLSFTNWFGDEHGRNQYSSSTYSSDQRYLVSGFARGLSLTLSYTFPYGKKVSRSDEITNEAIKKSAILE